LLTSSIFSRTIELRIDVDRVPNEIERVGQGRPGADKMSMPDFQVGNCVSAAGNDWVGSV